LHRQTWGQRAWDLAVSQGEDPSDPASILYGGAPSDAPAYAPPVETPGPHNVPRQLAGSYDTGAHAIDGTPGQLVRSAVPEVVRILVPQQPVAQKEAKGNKAKNRLRIKGLKKLIKAMRQTPVNVTVQQPAPPRLTRVVKDPETGAYSIERSDEPLLKDGDEE
jgi:hypothetical protein